jgi:hypothetical protein
MPDWNTRLEVKLGDVPIAPITAFNPQINTPHTVVGSIGDENLGYIRMPTQFTFSFTVQAIGSVAADLTELALNGTEFEIGVTERKGKDYAWKAVKFKKCIITGTSESIPVDGVPTVTFNCTSLQFGAEPEDG